MPTKDNTTPTTTKPSTVQDAAQSNAALQNYHSINEYKQNIPRLNSLFKNFISYDAFEICGTFNDFVYSNSNSIGDGYVYFLKDANNFQYCFHVVHGATIGDLDMGVLSSHDTPTDLRFNGEHSGYYYVGNIRYAYFEGKLYNIRWDNDDRIFLIQAADAQLHTYPLGGDTFMSRLLNAETAEAAVKEFHTRATSAQAEATH